MSAGTKESDRCRGVAVVERFKQEVMYGCPLGQKKVTVVERWPLVEVPLQFLHHFDFEA